MTRGRTATVSPGRGRVVVPALASGVGLALSLPPWGWWVLALPAAGLLWWRLGGLRPRTRLWAGWLAGLGLYVPGLFWASSFNLPGGLVLMAVEAAFLAVACLAVPAGPVVARAMAFPAALTLAEAARIGGRSGVCPSAGCSWARPADRCSGWPARRARSASPPSSTSVGAGLAALVGRRCGRAGTGPGPGLRPGRRRRARTVTGWALIGRAPCAGLGPWLVTAAVVALASWPGGAWAATPPTGAPVGRCPAAVQGGGVRGLRKSQMTRPWSSPPSWRPPGS